jgi:alpha/beta superfamily hydrolase
MRTIKDIKFQNVLQVTIIFMICIGFDQKAYAQGSEQTACESITFDSWGSKIHGCLYKSGSKASSPLVILFPGFIGSNGDPLGLAGKLKSAGFHTFTFNYRGIRKSGGIFLPENSLQDGVNSIRYLKTAEISRKYNIDTTQIVLVGYSWGGSVALLSALRFASITTIVSIATTDFKVFADILEENEDFRKKHQAYLDKIMSNSSLMRSLGGRASHEWIMEHKQNYDLKKHAVELSGKKILLVGGWMDMKAPVEIHLIPLYRAMQKNNSGNVKINIYDTDHSFKNVGEQLYRDIIAWIGK